jgi:hypothetical protein
MGPVANEQKLNVAPTALSGTGVTMATVGDHLKIIKDAIDREAGSGLPGAGLPFLAFSALGEVARHRYQSRCATASERVGKLWADAKDLADGLAKNAVAYVGTESELSAEMEKLNHKVPVTDDPAVKSSSSEIGTRDAIWSTGLVGAAGLYVQQWQQKATLDAAKKAVEGEHWAAMEKVLASEGISDDLLAKAVTASSVSAKMSAQTGAMLKIARNYSIAVVATSVAWEAGAIVRSDDDLNTAASTWKQAGVVTHRIFNEEVAAIKEVLFSEWISPEASAAARKKFADFEKSGRDFANWVNGSMTTSIDKVVTDLNNIHFWAFAFASVQLMALVAFVMFPAWSQAIGAYLNVTFTVVMNLIGMALGALILTPDVPT